MHATSNLIPAAICLAVLAACGKPEAPATPPPIAGASSPALASLCPSGPERPVNIHSITVSGSTATVIISPDPVHIGQNATGLRWKLSGSGGRSFAFTTDGIAFAPGAPSGPNSAPPTGRPDEFVWCFGQSQPNSSWKYSIKFREVGGAGPTWKCDPTILNTEVFVPPPSAAASGASAPPLAPATVVCLPAP